LVDTIAKPSDALSSFAACCASVPIVRRRSSWLRVERMSWQLVLPFDQLPGHRLDVGLHGREIAENRRIRVEACARASVHAGDADAELPGGAGHGHRGHEVGRRRLRARRPVLDDGIVEPQPEPGRAGREPGLGQRSETRPVDGELRRTLRHEPWTVVVGDTCLRPDDHLRFRNRRTNGSREGWVSLGC
jgi:hypothetical protein